MRMHTHACIPQMRLSSIYSFSIPPSRKSHTLVFRPRVYLFVHDFSSHLRLRVAQVLLYFGLTLIPAPSALEHERSSSFLAGRIPALSSPSSSKPKSILLYTHNLCTSSFTPFNLFQHCCPVTLEHVDERKYGVRVPGNRACQRVAFREL